MINFHWSDVIFVFKVSELYGGEGKLKVKKKNKVRRYKMEKVQYSSINKQSS